VLSIFRRKYAEVTGKLGALVLGILRELKLQFIELVSPRISTKLKPTRRSTESVNQVTPSNASTSRDVIDKAITP